MSYTIEDLKRDLAKKYFEEMTSEEQREVLRALPLEERLAGLTPEQIQQYLDGLNTSRQTAPRKPRRKK